MKLIDVLEIATEDTLIIVYDNELAEIARYDGKNSIPAELNDREVEHIFPAREGQLNIILY